MIFDLPTFTLLHVLVSLIGILAGMVVVGGLMAGARFDGWNATFLITTALTNISGFGFPFVRGLLPSHIVGVISLVILPVAIVARYPKRLEGSWRSVYVISAVTVLYLNVFVLMVQLFQKTPGLIILAPRQSSPAFVITQTIVLLMFVGIGRAILKVRP
jgi:hypothetical protein